MSMKPLVTPCLDALTSSCPLPPTLLAVHIPIKAMVIRRLPSPKITHDK